MTGPDMDPRGVFDVGRLAPPTDETYRAFEETFEALAPMASWIDARLLGSTRFYGRTLDESVRVHGTYIEYGEAGTTRDDAKKHAEIHVNARDAESYLDAGFQAPTNQLVPAGTEKAQFKRLVSRIADHQAEATGTWLRELSYQLLHLKGELLTSRLGKLFTDSPFQIPVQTRYGIDQTFNNGAKLDASWTQGNQGYHKSSKRQVMLDNPDGTSYIYTLEADGAERLLVIKPGEWGEPSVDSSPVGFIRGEPDLVSGLQFAMAKILEAQEAGADIITNGTLSDFTDDLKAALGSGPITN